MAPAFNAATVEPQAFQLFAVDGSLLLYCKLFAAAEPSTTSQVMVPGRQQPETFNPEPERREIR